MTLGSYLWGMRISTLFALACWVFVVTSVDPQEAGILGQVFFYLSTFLVLSGIFTLFFTWLREKSAQENPIFIGIGFRQGIFVSLLIVVLLFFQSVGILTWWDSLLVAAGICLFELYFLTKSA